MQKKKKKENKTKQSKNPSLWQRNKENNQSVIKNKTKHSVHGGAEIKLQNTTEAK